MTEMLERVTNALREADDLWWHSESEPDLPLADFLALAAIKAMREPIGRHMTMDHLKELALAAMETIFTRRALYDEVNQGIKKLNPDFPQTMTAVDTEIEMATVKVLDEILGETIASYFLYEACSMKTGGRIIERSGAEWPIETVAHVRAYVARPPS